MTSQLPAAKNSYLNRINDRKYLLPGRQMNRRLSIAYAVEDGRAQLPRNEG
jgi:hypothetical protein